MSAFSHDSRGTVTVVVPTFREAANIATLAERLDAALLAAGIGWEMIIVDDDSEDGIEDVVTKLARTLPVRLVVRRERPRDLSQSVVLGISVASRGRVVVMDADLSHPPERIGSLLAKLDDGCEIALGSRYLPSSSIEQTWGIGRFLTSRVATALARPLVRCSDPMSGFFAVDTSKLPSPSEFQPIGFKIALELIVRGRLRVCEVPIDFRDRAKGSSKLNLRQQWLFLRHLGRLYRLRYGDLARFLSFGLVGATGFVIDLAGYWGLQALGADHSVARLLSFWPAATWNWWLNRRSTFTDRAKRPWARQWIEFLGTSILGFTVNAGTYLGLTSSFEYFRAAPVTALICGVMLGAAVNFVVAAKYVYRRAAD